MNRLVVYLICIVSVSVIGCGVMDSEVDVKKQGDTRIEAIIEAIMHDWISPEEFGDELLENRTVAQMVWKDSIYFNAAHPISIEEILVDSYLRWEYFESAYRLADEIGNEDTKRLIRFLKGENLEDWERPLFGDYTASFQPESVLKNYTDESTYVKSLFSELIAERTYLRTMQEQGGVPTVFPEPRGVLYLVSYRAKEKGLCELGEILHEFARVELGLWDIGIETDYEDLFNLRVAAAGEPLEYFRLASILAELFMDCGNESYAEFWWNQAFRLHSVLREKEDGNRYYQIHRHLYKRMTESVPAEMMPLLRESQ